jgi:hypothetical protein
MDFSPTKEETKHGKWIYFKHQTTKNQTHPAQPSLSKLLY